MFSVASTPHILHVFVWDNPSQSFFECSYRKKNMLLYFETFQGHTYPITQPYAGCFGSQLHCSTLRIWWCRAWWRRVPTSSTSTSPAHRWRMRSCGHSQGTRLLQVKTSIAVCLTTTVPSSLLYWAPLRPGPMPSRSQNLYYFCSAGEIQSSARLARC